VTNVVVDTGPLVAFLNRRDRHHVWVRDLLDSMEPPLFTCEAVLSEACFLLQGVTGGQDAVLGLVSRGVLRSDFRLASEVDSVRALMHKFANVPMSLADACLVRMTELDAHSAILTLDADFGVYRRHRRQVIPTILPTRRGGG
jgi:predicted nucleic acid-binding protein